MEIITTPNPLLLKKSTEVQKIDKKIKDLIAEMKVTLAHTFDPKGVGLAAPQIGVNIRIFIAKPTDESPHLICINPKIIKVDEVPKVTTKSTRRKSLLEGCLSIPTIWGPVERAKSVTLEYLDENGKSHQKTFKGFIATVIQHEVDHLDGVLFTKRNIEQGQKLYRSYKNAEGEDEFDEIKV
jgi:peptide deformylase